MRPIRIVHALYTACFLAVCIGGSVHAQNALDPDQVDVQFRFEPGIIEPGQFTTLGLSFVHELSGMNQSLRPPNSIQIPKVAGLQFDAMAYSTSRRTSFNNISGARTIYTITYPFRVRAESPGFYTISPFVVDYMGATFNVAGASLEVIDTSNNSHAESVIMELIMPQEQVYVGETVKATIQIWIKEEFRDSQIQSINKVGTAFTEGTRSQREIPSRATRSGAIYNVNSWPITITPIKGGEQTIQYEARTRISKGSRSRSVFDLLNQRFGINSPISQSRMGSNSSRDVRDFIVNTEPRSIPVKPLPLRSQPTFFSGAIGDFGLKVVPSAGGGMVGNHIHLTVDIIGQGNFNRIQAPPLDLGKDWKTFEPESDFQAGDALSYSGRKRFTYTLIPTHENVTAIPPVKFAYFDPTGEAYKVVETGAIPVSIEPNPDAENFEDYFAELEDAEEANESDAGDLISSIGRQISVPTPLAYASTFRWSQLSVLVLLLSGFTLLKIRQNLAKDERRKRLQEATTQMNKFGQAGEQAMNSGDARAFLISAAGEVRAAITASFGKSAEAWTSEEFQNQTAPDDVISEELLNETFDFLRKTENALFRNDSDLSDFQYSEWKATSSSLSGNWLKAATSSRKRGDS